MGFYPHFNLPMDRSHGFGSIATNFIRPIQTRSRFASGTQYLKLASDNNSPDHSTKGTRSHFNVLSLLVSTRFQVLFHSPPGVLFTFPSRYCSSIGHQVDRVSRVRRYSGTRLAKFSFHLRGSHPLWLAFPCHSVNLFCRCVAPQPR